METAKNPDSVIISEEVGVPDCSSQSPAANPRKRAHDDQDGDMEQDENGASENDGDLKPSEGVQGAAEQSRISKNQLKKLKRQKLWEEKKADRRSTRKEKRHEKTARRRLEREEKAMKLAEAQGIDKTEAMKQTIAAEHKEHKPKSVVPVSFIIDCDFEKYMRETENVSLGAQITRSYAMNKAGQYQAHIIVSSWGGFLKQRFAVVLKDTHLNWKGTHFVDYDFVEAGKTAWEIMHGPKGGKLCPALGGGRDQPGEASDDKPKEVRPQSATDKALVETNSTSIPEFTKNSIVYLSADSPNVLDKLEPYTSYVIGGLVDRNREKLLCQKRAEEKGIRTAKLPIGDYMQMASRQVLATNHVVEIMSKWLETGDWGTAFLEVIPKRKGGKLKGEDGDDEEEEHDEKEIVAEAERNERQNEKGEKQDEVTSDAVA